MRETFSKIRNELKHPYFCALLLIACVPIFPEYVSFLLVIAATAFAAKDMRINKRKLRIGIIGKVLMVYCGYQTISSLYSTHPLPTFSVSMMWWFFFIAYLMVVNLLIDAHRTERFLLCMTVVAGIIGLIACVQYRINVFIGRNVDSTWLWLDNIVFKALDAFGIEIFYLDYKLRAFSTFSNPNMLAQYLVMVAPFVACYNFMKQRNNRLRLLSRTCLFFTFAGVMFSFSRGGYLAMAILALALIVLNIRRHFAAVFLCIISALLFLPNEVISRIFSIKKGISNSNTIANNIASSTPKPNINASSTTATEIIHKTGAETAVGERWEIWMESIERFLDRPLFGHGAGTQATFDIFEAIGIQAPHAHNIILQLLLEGGIVGLTIMGLIGFFVIRNSFRMMKIKNSTSMWMGFSLILFGVSFMAHGMVDYPLMAPRLILMFIIILGIADQTVHIYATDVDSNTAKRRKRWLRGKI